MLDIKLVTEGAPDLALDESRAVVLEDDVRSSMLISLYTTQGWWADPDAGVPVDLSPRDRPAQLRAYQASLQWMVDEGALTSVEVIDDAGNLLVEYQRPGSERETLAVPVIAEAV